MGNRLDLGKSGRAESDCVGVLNDFWSKCDFWVAVLSAKNHKRQRRKRQSVTAKREKSQTPKFVTAILTLPNLTLLNLT